jgi:lipopolysaccharide/colanic/teichoic acid biosynthesis glycosyltransferase
MGQIQNRALYEGVLAMAEGETAVCESSYTVGFAEHRSAPTYSWRYLNVKRAVDFLASSLMIAIFALPGLAIAAVIAFTSRGSVFYREERIGRGGRPFRIWKFRSMYQDANKRSHMAESGADGKVLHWRMKKHLRDPRITPIGGFLRKWSLDEVPQCFNVLRGEMSLIGPRPIVEAEAHLYGDLLDYYLAATPGLSGLWQVSGRSNVDYKKRAQLDATYVMTWSLWADLVILFKTIPAVLQRVGAR